MFVTRRPVEAEAFVFSWDQLPEVQKLVQCRPITPEQEENKQVLMVTPLGSKELNEGDYLMKSQHGQWYPIPTAVFEQIYTEKKLTPAVELPTPTL